MKLPESITTELFVTVGVGQYNKGQINVRDFFLRNNISEGVECVLLKKISIDIDIPQDFDGVGAMVEQLQARKKKMEADHYVAVKQVENQIAELLAISDKGEDK